MNETENTQKDLFKNDTYENDRMNLVIEDKNEKDKYLLDEIKNKVVLGDTFKVLKKMALLQINTLKYYPKPASWNIFKMK